MKRFQYICIAALIMALTASCKKSDSNEPVVPSKWPAKINTVEAGTFVLVEKSNTGFVMGDDNLDGSKPAHSVKFSKSYYMGMYEVTQSQWESIMGSNPSEIVGADKPVTNINISDIEKFIKALNEKSGREFRLPTEAEWEFAAIGGVKSQGFAYSGGDNADDVAWFVDNSGDDLHSVGQKQPNELGIYDMSGNAAEWCSDRFAEYTKEEQTDPTGAKSGTFRVYRGGMFDFEKEICLSKSRKSTSASAKLYNLGFRLVLTKPLSKELE